MMFSLDSIVYAIDIEMNTKVLIKVTKVLYLRQLKTRNSYYMKPN